jgi:hypothetical protein
MTLIIDSRGTKRWYNLKNQLHREEGPAVEYLDGYTEWYINGKLHREDGPAVYTADGYKAWWLNDKLHRVGGPAIEWPDGTKSWWFKGNQMKEKDYLKIIHGK